MTAPAGTSPARLRLSLAQLRYLADLAGAALPAELAALADAAARYDGGTDCGLEDLVARGVVTRDAAGTVAAAEQVSDDLRLLGSSDVALDVRGRVGQTVDGRPDVQLTPREPADLSADLAPLLESEHTGA